MSYAKRGQELLEEAGVPMDSDIVMHAREERMVKLEAQEELQDNGEGGEEEPTLPFES